MSAQIVLRRLALSAGVLVVMFLLAHRRLGSDRVSDGVLGEASGQVLVQAWDEAPGQALVRALVRAEGWARAAKVLRPKWAPIGRARRFVLAAANRYRVANVSVLGPPDGLRMG